MTLLHHNLQAFVAVKEHATVAAAAKVLHLTQAAVTLRVQALEQELKTTLFLRSRRGMQLTAAGEELARFCLRSLELEAEFLPNLTTDTVDTSPVTYRLQAPSSVMSSRIVPHIKVIHEKFPHVNLSLEIEDLESGIERLKRGAIDLLVCERSQVTKEFDSKVLKSERYILVGPKAWSKRDLKEILKTERIIDFDATDKMTMRFLEKYKLPHRSSDDRHFLNLTQGIAELVGQKLGYSVLSEEMAQAYLERQSLVNLAPGKFFDYQIAAVWHVRKQMPKAFAALIKTLN